MKKRKRKGWLIFGVFLAILFVSGCGQTEDSDSNQYGNGSGNGDNNENGGYNDGTTIIPSTTKVISQEDEWMILDALVAEKTYLKLLSATKYRKVIYKRLLSHIYG